MQCFALPGLHQATQRKEGTLNYQHSHCTHNTHMHTCRKYWLPHFYFQTQPKDATSPMVSHVQYVPATSIFAHTYIYIYIYSYMHLYLHIRTSTSTYTATCIYMHIRTYTSTYTATCIYMHIRTYVHIDVARTYVHTYLASEKRLIKSLTGVAGRPKTLL